LRGKSCPIDAEVEEMMLCCRKAGEPAAIDANKDVEENLLTSEDGGQDKGQYYAMLFPPLWRVLVLMALVGLCGADGIFYYVLSVFREARMVTDAYGCVICMELGVAVAYLAINPFMDRIPRKLLGTSASALMALSHAVLSFTLWHGSGDNDPMDMTWTESFCFYWPPVFVFLFSAGYGGGLACVAWALSGELFPPPVRSVGCPLAIAARYTIVFFELKAYPWLLDLGPSLGPSTAVLVHGVSCAITVIFIFCCIPETLVTYFYSL
jgi:hypothetical protein